MKSSKLELRKIIEQYADEELTDFLEYEINKNDINGIVEKEIKEIDKKKKKRRKIKEQKEDEELTDFLEYKINKNDINGIVENAINDIDEIISEYIEMISK